MARGRLTHGTHPSLPACSSVRGLQVYSSCSGSGKRVTLPLSHSPWRGRGSCGAAPCSILLCCRSFSSAPNISPFISRLWRGLDRCSVVFTCCRVSYPKSFWGFLLELWVSEISEISSFRSEIGVWIDWKINSSESGLLSSLCHVRWHRSYARKRVNFDMGPSHLYRYMDRLSNHIWSKRCRYTACKDYLISLLWPLETSAG